MKDWENQPGIILVVAAVGKDYDLKLNNLNK